MSDNSGTERPDWETDCDVAWMRYTEAIAAADSAYNLGDFQSQEDWEAQATRIRRFIRKTWGIR